MPLIFCNMLRVVIFWKVIHCKFFCCLLIPLAAACSAFMMHTPHALAFSLKCAKNTFHPARISFRDSHPRLFSLNKYRSPEWNVNTKLSRSFRACTLKCLMMLSASDCLANWLPWYSLGSRHLLFDLWLNYLTTSIRRVTLIAEFDTLWLSPGIIETSGSKLVMAPW